MNKSDNSILRPKAGTNFRIDERIYKAIDDSDEVSCNRCVFYPRGLQHRCQAPKNLICEDVYFEDRTHELGGQKNLGREREKESKRMYWLATAVATLILIGIYIYKIIEN